MAEKEPLQECFIRHSRNYSECSYNCGELEDPSNTKQWMRDRCSQRERAQSQRMKCKPFPQKFSFLLQFEVCNKRFVMRSSPVCSCNINYYVIILSKYVIDGLWLHFSFMWLFFCFTSLSRRSSFHILTKVAVLCSKLCCLKYKVVT
jgi:hypothetical protein